MTFSLTDFRNKHNVWLPKPHDCWRLVPDGVVGQIAGLPSFRGTAIATNGIHVAIERGQDVVIGHLEWFIADDLQKEASLLDTSAAKLSPQPKLDILAELFI